MAKPIRVYISIVCIMAVSACNAEPPNSIYAPGIDRSAKAVDGKIVAQRLMSNGEYELALKSYSRAAAQTGMTPDILAGIATANLKLGRLHQAEKQFRKVLVTNKDNPAIWNNLGIVLIELGKTSEATAIFKRAFALDNGKSDAIKNNYNLSLNKLENNGYTNENKTGGIISAQFDIEPFP